MQHVVWGHLHHHVVFIAVIQYYKVMLHLLPLPVVKGECGWLTVHPVCTLVYFLLVFHSDMVAFCSMMQMGGMMPHMMQGMPGMPPGNQFNHSFSSEYI